MKNESSLFMDIILQCNIITITYFISHVRTMSQSILYINKVIQYIYIYIYIYYICTFGLIKGKNANTVSPIKREQYGGAVHLFIGKGSSPSKNTIMTLISSHYSNTNIKDKRVFSLLTSYDV
jgi:hypothetical protein